MVRELSYLLPTGLAKTMLQRILSCNPLGRPPNKGIGQDEIQVAVVSSSAENISLLSQKLHGHPVFRVTNRTEKGPLHHDPH